MSDNQRSESEQQQREERMDILASLVLEVRCPSCGQSYRVSAASVLDSRAMLNEGCASRGASECPPLYLAALLNAEDLRELREVAERLNRQAAAKGIRLFMAPSR